ncbi:MAG: LLM class F420-dependent oxidoreductase [Acidobacteriota bacterium]|nr:LLM class F420-dependent oxidoreductase [Acidobacteriota bacterium]
MGYGITIPFDGVPLADHRPWIEEVAELGYSDVWTAEADGTDGFTPLAMSAAWAPGLRLGTAIIPTFTRGPALLAQSAAALAEAAPGRFVLGVGTSSDVIVERWNGLSFDQPYRRTRDMVRFLRSALAGEKVSAAYDTFEVRGFRLARPPQVVPPILVAGLRPGMLRLAGREGDGAVINWLGAADVARVAAEVGPGKEVVARLFVLPSEDRQTVLAVGRRMVAAYLNVPVYAAFHEWLGRGPSLQAMWDAWRAGDRKAALEAIPEAVVDDLILSGSPPQIRAKVQAYLDAGVTTVTLLVVAAGADLRQAVRDLAPRP